MSRSYFYSDHLIHICENRKPSYNDNCPIKPTITTSTSVNHCIENKTTTQSHHHYFSKSAKLKIPSHAETFLASGDLPTDIRAEILGRNFEDRDKPVVWENQSYFPIHFRKRDLYKIYKKINKSDIGWKRLTLHSSWVTVNEYNKSKARSVDSPASTNCNGLQYCYVGEYSFAGRFEVRMILQDHSEFPNLLMAYPVEVVEPSPTPNESRVLVPRTFSTDNSTSATTGSHQREKDQTFLNLDDDKTLAEFRRLLQIF